MYGNKVCHCMMFTHHSGHCYGKKKLTPRVCNEIDHEICHHIVKVVWGSAIVHYAKPNVAIFNIAIFIQFNPYSFNIIFLFIQFNLRSFNSIPIVILFNLYSFNSIFRSIQLNFCILLIQFRYWFNLISVFIQFNFSINSIQCPIHSIQFSYSFNSIRLYSFNLRTHSFNLGVWVEKSRGTETFARFETSVFSFGRFVFLESFCTVLSLRQWTKKS